MQSNLQIEQLFQRWQRLLDEGQYVPAEELCADCPELTSELEKRILKVESEKNITEPDNCVGSSTKKTQSITVDCTDPVHSESDAVDVDPANASDQLGAVVSLESDDSVREAPTNGQPVSQESNGSHDVSLQTMDVSGTIEDLPGFNASEPTRTLPAGKRMVKSISNYGILRLHAKGGLGEVYLASDMELNRDVALKFIKEDHAKKQISLTQFQLEGEVTARLEHPGIVPVYGMGQTDEGRPFHAMQFISGDTLADVIDDYHESEAEGSTEQSLIFENLISRFISVCNTIAYAHNRGILHRDIKPDNVMLGKYGETLVVDWGLALPVARDDVAKASGEQTLMPGSGSSVGEFSNASVVGTPFFMSPEQAAGAANLTPATDVYSLGAVLYKLITGDTPFHGSQLRDILRKVKKGDFRRPTAVKPGVPRALEAICLRAMARNPKDRYSTALELKADVERWRADEPVSAYQARWHERLRYWSQHHRKLTQTVLALLLTATVAVTSWLTSEWNHREILIAQRLEDLKARADVEQEMLVRDFRTLEQDATFLATTQALQELSNGKQATDQAKQSVAASFREFLRHKPSYMQARFLDREGMEIVRVDRHNPGGEVSIRQQAKLQPKKTKTYFKETIKLSRDEVYLSDVELNQEYGQKQWDFPVIRAAVPVFEATEPIGIVVINMHFSRLAGLVNKSATEELLVYLTNGEGQFLLHPNSHLDFCFERKLKYRIEDIYPRLATFRLNELKLTKVKPVVAVLLEPQTTSEQNKDLLNDAVTALVDAFPNRLRPTFSGERDKVILSGVEPFELEVIRQQIKKEFDDRVTVHLLPTKYRNTNQAVYCRKVHFDDRSPSRFLCLVLVLPY